MRIVMIGTRGVPARYGGFETAVEEVGQRLVARGHQVTVFCRESSTGPAEHLGIRLVHLPSVRRKALETLSHTTLSVLHTEARRADVAFVFNAANAPLLPVLRAMRVPTALHVDGLEWKRSKWSGTGQKYYLLCERLGVKLADELISDARGIQDYYLEEHGTGSRFVPYGAPILHAPAINRLSELGASMHGYHLKVARFEPENHVDLVVEGYISSRARLPLLVVGAAPYAKTYVDRIEQLASRDSRVRLLGSIWDQELLNALYAGAASYLHGHSVGGTNPSLLRAMGAASPVAALDVVFNREVLADTGVYWQSSADVAQAVEAAEQDTSAARERGLRSQLRAAESYNWEDVSRGYEAIAQDLASGWSRRRDRQRLFPPYGGKSATVSNVNYDSDGSEIANEA